ncbi:hypothetical protein SFRURICE_006896, partial [Spodoptera frugiperda]
MFLYGMMRAMDVCYIVASGIWICAERVSLRLLFHLRCAMLRCCECVWLLPVIFIGTRSTNGDGLSYVFFLWKCVLWMRPMNACNGCVIWMRAMDMCH